MGTIKKRGKYQFQRIIRLKDYPEKTKTHQSEAKAKAWIELTEATMKRRSFKDTAKELDEPVRNFVCGE